MRVPLKSLKILFGILITVFFFSLFAKNIRFRELLDSIQSLSWPLLLTAMFALTADYVFRVLRWQIMLNAIGSRIRFPLIARFYMISITVNNTLPLRAGDFYRIVAPQKPTGLNYASLAGTVVIERVMDLSVLLLLLTIALRVVNKNLPIEISTLVDSLSVLVLVGLILIVGAPKLLLTQMVKLQRHRLIEKKPLFKKVITKLILIVNGFSLISKKSFGLLLLSALIWILEAAFFYFVSRSLFLNLGAVETLYPTVVGTLSTLVPSSPGYVGTFHYFTYQSLSQFQLDESKAASFIVLVHAFLWGATTLAGALFFVFSPMKKGELASNEEII